MNSLQSVVAWVYVSMSDKVVDWVMRRRGSRGLGWLKQPPTVEQCETIPNISISSWHL